MKKKPTRAEKAAGKYAEGTVYDAITKDAFRAGYKLAKRHAVEAVKGIMEINEPLINANDAVAAIKGSLK